MIVSLQIPIDVQVAVPVEVRIDNATIVAGTCHLICFVPSVVTVVLLRQAQDHHCILFAEQSEANEFVLANPFGLLSQAQNKECLAFQLHAPSIRERLDSGN